MDLKFVKGLKLYCSTFFFISANSTGRFRKQTVRYWDIAHDIHIQRCWDDDLRKANNMDILSPNTWNMISSHVLCLVSTPIRGHARVDILGVEGGGVRWGGGVITFFSTSTTWYVLLHILHFHTYVMLRCWTFSCTSTHMSCYAAGRSRALPHLRHAPLLDLLLHFHTYVTLRCWTFSCTSTHT